jgi:hypothetical protein
MRRRALLVLAVAALLIGAAPARAKPYFKAYGPIIVELWDHYGIFHRLILRLMVEFPKSPRGMPHTIESDITQQLQSIPYEVLRKPNSSALIKAVTLKVVRSSLPGKAAERVLIQDLSFQ